MIKDISLLSHIHPSWHAILKSALSRVDTHYYDEIRRDPKTLPKLDQLFNAFSLPLTNVKTILFGESPYPREQSANGYAFWDNAVTELWSDTGLTTIVNKATSLRNIIKMLLIADGKLNQADTSQTAIAEVDKSSYIKSGHELFENFMSEGILLLNASLVFRTPQSKNQDARAWLPFMEQLLLELSTRNQQIKLLLFGKIANIINGLDASAPFDKLQTEHPYNLSFINNTNVVEFFRPLMLLHRKDTK